MISDRPFLAEMLRRHDIIPTHQRLIIAQVLLARHQHVSADQLLALVNEQHAEVSKATIYNTLNLFEEKGLIRGVIVDPVRVFYDTNTLPHHHFFDEESGTLTDIEPDSLSIGGLPSLPAGMVQERVDIVVRIRRQYQ
ncbi:MAG: transcriptional repressor [Betaproteobacteria bacterium]|nr:transcriptional repressor [Betaproteobacteria bacterium]MDE2131201.1 transcriptional repressor [Betaproteobacteria bacterium]MDE2211199.1 transcriptional repressor [Betaproteobacteria bacterium]